MLLCQNFKSTDGFFERVDRRVVIRLLRDLGDDFDISDFIVRVDDEHGAGEEGNRQPLDQNAEVLAEAVIVDVGEVREVGDFVIGAESSLRERQIEAHGERGELIPHRRERLGELLGLDAANGGVERGDDVEETRLARRIGEFDDREPRPHAREIGGFIAGFELRSDQFDRIPTERHLSLARFAHRRHSLLKS